jgi:hypothetical protein
MLFTYHLELKISILRYGTTVGWGTSTYSEALRALHPQSTVRTDECIKVPGLKALSDTYPTGDDEISRFIMLYGKSTYAGQLSADTGIQ